MRKPAEKKIGEFEYRVAEFMTSDGLEFAARVGRLIAPAIAQLPDDGGIEASNHVIGGALRDVLAQPALGPELRWVCARLADQTQVFWYDGAEKSQTLSKIFETHFAGNYSDLIQWLIFGLQATIGSFLSPEIRALFRGRPSATKTDASSLKSPNSVERTG